MKSPHTARVIDRRSFYAYLFLMFFFIGCESQSTHQYIELPLKGQVTDRNEEISSMTIYNYYLRTLMVIYFGYHYMRLRKVLLGINIVK